VRTVSELNHGYHHAFTPSKLITTAEIAMAALHQYYRGRDGGIDPDDYVTQVMQA
jgi:hypothetical protein